MSTRKSDAAPAAPAEPCRHLLGHLARAGARAEPRQDGSVLVSKPQAAGRVVEIEVEAGVWRRAVDEDWVGTRSGEEGWTLTRKGRAHLKKILSGAGSPAVPVSAITEPSEPASEPGFNLRESPLGWLSRRRDKDGNPLISSHEFQAGERLRADFTFAHMSPRVTSSWSPANGGSSDRRSAPGTGVEIQDCVIAAGERVHRALAAVGPELAGILIDVCCYLKGLEDAERVHGWPQRSGKVVLQLALTRLARHYGIEPSSKATRAPARSIRHWGSVDYRPTLEGWR